METAHTVKKVLYAALLSAMSLLMVSASQADTLKFRNTPASNVVSEMNSKLGVTIVLRSTIAPNQTVTFSVDDPNSPAGRLQAINDLANALGMDFQKVYVVSKIDAGATVPEVKIDSDGAVAFSSTKVSAREAIQTVAAVDGAISQISGAIQGDVTFPSRRLSAADAAALIAKQTQTGWKAYYGLFRRGEMPARLGGVVVDQTNLGQPITELPLVNFRDINPPAPTPPPVNTTTSTTANGTAPGATDTTGAQTPAGTPNSYLPYGADPYGTNPYAYNPYTYGNPYGYDPYGNSGYGGMDYGSGGGFGSSNSISGGTPTFGGGASVFTLPNTSFQGGPSFGSPFVIGGY